MELLVLCVDQHQKDANFVIHHLYVYIALLDSTYYQIILANSVQLLYKAVKHVLIIQLVHLVKMAIIYQE
jgi:hypothetical protein